MWTFKVFVVSVMIIFSLLTVEILQLFDGFFDHRAGLHTTSASDAQVGVYLCQTLNFFDSGARKFQQTFLNIAANIVIDIVGVG